jgi:surface protein
MFYGASVFNQPIGNWNTTAVTTMINMFRNASAFNQNIRYQAVSKWNTAAVTSMLFMFNGATTFNNGEGAGGTTAPLGWLTTGLATLPVTGFKGGLCPLTIANNVNSTGDQIGA